MIPYRFLGACSRLTSLHLTKQTLFAIPTRHLSRSIARDPKRTPSKNAQVTIAVSPLLTESIEKRLNSLKVEVDLGLGLVAQESKDVLEESIIKAVKMDHLLELIATNYRYMNTQHISQCLQTVDNIIKFSDNGKELRLDLLASREFHLLANRTLKLARHLEPTDALKALFVVQRVGISMDTLLAQSLLQIVRFSINEYSIDDLHQLMRFLRTVHKASPIKSTLIDAILLALPYAVKNRIINKELDFYNARTILRCLEMFVFFGNTFHDINILRKCLHFINKSTDHLSLQESVNLLSHVYSLNIMDIDTINLSKSIASKCIDRILNYDKTIINSMPSYIWVNVLSNMKRNHNFYDRKLFEFIGELAFDNPIFTTNDLYLILSKNWNFKFVNYKLLSHFANLIETKPTNCEVDSEISLIKLLRHFTLPSDYERVCSNFAPICENILLAESFHTETAKSRMAIFYFLKYCLILNVNLRESLIKEWFDKYLQLAFQESVHISNRHIFLKTMAYIYQGLLINSYLCDELEQDVKEKLQIYMEEYKILLKNELASKPNPILDEIYFFASNFGQFGGCNFTKNYITESGLVVDLLIQTNLSKSFGVVLLSRQNYCREPKIIDGETKFQIKRLQMSKIYPIAIDMGRWEALNDYEKKQFFQLEFNSVNDIENEI